MTQAVKSKKFRQNDYVRRLTMFQITLKAARELSGYTLEEVAEYCGVTVDELNKIEKDSNFLTVNIMLKIKKLYNDLPLRLSILV